MTDRAAVVLLNFLVNWLLLMGTNCFCGYGSAPGRTAVGSALGGLYSGACFLPGFAFLGNTFWHLVTLALISVITFGFFDGGFRRGIVFLLLSMAIEGITLGIGGDRLWVLPLAAGSVCLLCILGFRGRLGTNYIPVELTFGDRQLRITALQDTGNTLRDPVTGCPVLVVDRDAACKLTGLTDLQLQQPVNTIGSLPGLRLIPYRSVGTENGMLLGLYLKEVKIGSWKGSRVVAFAPGKLSLNGEYQALTGGML